MKRRILAAALFASPACAIEFPDYPVGDFAPPPPPASALGAACASDADCPSGICWQDGSPLLVAGSPPGGVCTATCSDETPCPDDAYCHDFGAGVSLCLERCTHGDGDPDKCHGRRELGCTILAGESACLPSCNDDGECASGVCDRVTSLCAAAQTGGALELLELCPPQSTDCRGTCMDGRCVERCVKGAPLACRPAAGSLLDPACILPLQIGAAIGDIGVCTRDCCPAGCPGAGFACNLESDDKQYCGVGVIDQCSE